MNRFKLLSFFVSLLFFLNLALLVYWDEKASLTDWMKMLRQFNKNDGPNPRKRKIVKATRSTVLERGARPPQKETKVLVIYRL